MSVSDPSHLQQQLQLQQQPIVIRHQACNKCHLVKTACNGLFPCSRCIRLGLLEECTPHPRKIGRRKGGISQRAATLQQLLQPTKAREVVEAILVVSQPQCLAANVQVQFHAAAAAVAPVEVFASSSSSSSSSSVVSPLLDTHELLGVDLNSEADFNSSKSISEAAGRGLLPIPTPVRAISSSSSVVLHNDLEHHHHHHHTEQRSDIFLGTDNSKPSFCPSEHLPSTPSGLPSYQAGVNPLTPLPAHPRSVDLEMVHFQNTCPPDQLPINSLLTPSNDLEMLPSQNMQQQAPSQAAENPGQLQHSNENAATNSTGNNDPSKSNKRHWVSGDIFEELSRRSIKHQLSSCLKARSLSINHLNLMTSFISEAMHKADFTKLTYHVPAPIACSVRAEFAWDEEFVKWSQKVSESLEESSEPTSSPSNPIKFMETLYSDSPLLCVEDEQLACGLQSSFEMQQRALEVPVATFFLRAAKQKSNSNHQTDSHGMEENDSSRHRRSRLRSSTSSFDSSFSRSKRRSSSRSTSRSRSRSRSKSRSRSRSRSKSRFQDKYENRDHSSHRGHRRRDRNRKRYEPNSDSDEDRRDDDRRRMAKELKRRVKAYHDRTPLAEFDVNTVVHTPKCKFSNLSPENNTSDAKSTEVTSVASPMGTVMQNISLGVSNSPATSSSLCSCPVVTQRRMIVQVNREFERLFGYTQADVRQLFLRDGHFHAMKRFLFPRMKSNHHVALASLQSLVTGAHDFRIRQSVRTKYDHDIECHTRVQVLQTEDGDSEGCVYSFTPI